MSLSASDLNAIRKIVEAETRDVIQSEVPYYFREEISKNLAPISIKMSKIMDILETQDNDIKEIYEMVANLQKTKQDKFKPSRR